MQLMQIRPTEQVCVDQERLELLYTQLGEVGAEEDNANFPASVRVRV